MSEIRVTDKLLTKMSEESETDLGVEHDLRRSVPASSNVLSEKTGMIVIRVRHPGESKIADFEIARCVEKKIGGLQVSVKHVGRVDVLQPAENLVEEIADVIVR